MGLLTQTRAHSRVRLVTTERFAEHVTPPGHPERAERAHVMQHVARGWRDAGGIVSAPRVASSEDLARVHSREHLQAIAATAGRSVPLDPDTYTSPESDAVARLAAGAVLTAVDQAMVSRSPSVAFVRPPGHHAERDRAMGFCLYNNVAVGAAYARSLGVRSVAVVDYDVHHGNGTQWIFYNDPSVLFVSTHQYPFYPGTGAHQDVGTGDGEGLTVNLPLSAGAGDADYDLVFRAAVLPVLEAFSPELVLVSAGYDAHQRDPLGGMAVSTDGYLRLTRRLCQFAHEHCDGRLVAVTEGGYDLTALEQCLSGLLEVASEPPGGAEPSLRDGSTTRAELSLEGLRRAQGRFWPAL